MQVERSHDMNYRANFIEGMTIEDINAEIKEMHEDLYRYGRPIDRPRMWDLEFTKACLKQEDK